jgi:C-terminal processing protease CtpA/Prc
MRRLLLLPLLLFWLIALACGGGEVINEAIACPTPTAEDTSAIATPPPSATDFARAVADATDIVRNYYVDDVPAVQPLYQAAWTGVRSRLEAAGVQDIPERLRGAPFEEFKWLAAKSPSSIGTQELIDVGLSALAASMKDHHTYYIPSTAWSAERRGLRSSFGLLSERYSGGAVITAILPGSPADKAGLRIGDLIRTLNGVSLSQPSGAYAVHRDARVGGRLNRLPAYL